MTRCEWPAVSGSLASIAAASACIASKRISTLFSIRRFLSNRRLSRFLSAMVGSSRILTGVMMKSEAPFYRQLLAICTSPNPVINTTAMSEWILETSSKSSIQLISGMEVSVSNTWKLFSRRKVRASKPLTAGVTR